MSDEPKKAYYQTQMQLKDADDELMLEVARADAVRWMNCELGTVIEESVAVEVRKPNPRNPGDFTEDGRLLPYALVRVTANVVPHPKGG